MYALQNTSDRKNRANSAYCGGMRGNKTTYDNKTADMGGNAFNDFVIRF